MTRSREVSKGATRVEYVYTATAGQTSFSGNDANSNSLAYTAGQIDVFLNGVRLVSCRLHSIQWNSSRAWSWCRGWRYY